MLVVDDEHVFRAALTVALSKVGLEVETAANGQRALDMLKLGKPDLILLDINMPQMDGEQFLVELKRIDALDIPCIILTNNEFAMIPEHVAAFMVKSNTSIDEVVAKVQEIIG